MAIEHAVNQTIRQWEEWLSRHPAPDDKRFYYGKISLSAREIVEEIKAGTEIGLKHVRMMEEYFEKTGMTFEEFIETVERVKRQRQEKQSKE